MRCTLCDTTAAISDPGPFCRTHFISHFEKTVQDTITTFDLLRTGQRVAVACSGGKDSSALLCILHALGHDVTALAVDEGIAGYRDRTLADLRSLCARLGVPLRIVSYQESFGTTLDAHLAKNPTVRACSACGVWRRHLLNKHAHDFDVIATGHNLDDEAQSVLMNLLQGAVKVLSRMGPRSGSSALAQFTPRVKPLYFSPERETAAYALLSGISSEFTECPHAKNSLRALIRDELNTLESSHRGAKRAVIDWFLRELPRLRRSCEATASLRSCTRCGEPSEQDVCRACAQRSSLRVVLN